VPTRLARGAPLRSHQRQHRAVRAIAAITRNPLPVRRWIPPGALIFAQASHGASWLLLAFIATRGGFESSGPAIAWVHLVALGWFSMSALGILIHVIPTFTDLPWSYEPLARWALLPFGGGVVVFAGSWFLAPSGLALGAAILIVGLAGYLFAAAMTLSKAHRAPRTERAIARALALTLLMFAITASLGGLMMLALVGAAPVSWLTRLPAVHANLGFFGWLSLLIFGVSVRTIRPISGGGSRFRWIHVSVATLALAGIVVLTLGLATGARSAEWLGAACLGLAVTAYIVDMADALRRATVPHRPPQAFVAAALAWLTLASVMGAGVLAGSNWRGAFAFTFLVGWVGQMVNAHVFHIGVRLIATVYRGDYDETRPHALLEGRLSWLAFGSMQVAVGLCASGLLLSASNLVTAGAVAGFLSWCAIVANLGVARSRAKLPKPVSAV
jgi:uncharacterized membrane protein SirB2